MEDHTRIIGPGQTIQIAATGEFVYCKAAAKRWRLIIEGAPIMMERGDLRREVKRFDNIELHNPDSKYPVKVTVVIGFGNYDRKIIQGEIAALDGVYKADGSFADNRSYRLPLRWNLQRGFSPETTNKNEFINTSFPVETYAQNSFGRDQMGGIWVYGGLYESTHFIFNRLVDNGGMNASPQYTVSETQHIEPYPGGLSYYTVDSDGVFYSWQNVKGIYQLNANNYVKQTDDAPAGYHKGHGNFDKYGRLWIVESGIGGQDDRLTYYDSAFNRTLFTTLTAEELPIGSISGIEIVDEVIYLMFDSGGTTRELHKISAVNGDYLGSDSVNSMEQSTGGLVRIGNNWYVATPSNRTITKTVAETYTIGGRGFASYAGGGSDVRIFKFKSSDLFESLAAVTYTESESGNIVEGEIIRLALELYYGKSVDVDEYLDFVYGIELTAPTLQSEFPPYQVHKVKGKTFAAAGIADNFRAHTAGEMTIILDDQLPFME